MKGLLIFNRYYADEGQAYVKARLTECFQNRGAVVTTPVLNAGIGTGLPVPSADFAVFWDKDIALARFLERQGIRVYNRSSAIEVCDDKRKTYEALSGCGVPLIPTVFAPLAYAPSDTGDPGLTAAVADAFGFPVVVKENVGSQGKQVYLAETPAGLNALNRRLFVIPHQYQPRVGRFGSDTRVYTVGGAAVAAVVRENDGFASNVGMGGVMKKLTLNKPLKALAETVAKKLCLDYGAIDFLEADGQYYFLEANSNAYIRAAENLGFDIAGAYAEYICGKH